MTTGLGSPEPIVKGPFHSARTAYATYRLLFGSLGPQFCTRGVTGLVIRYKSEKHARRYVCASPGSSFRLLLLPPRRTVLPHFRLPPDDCRPSRVVCPVRGHDLRYSGSASGLVHKHARWYIPLITELSRNRAQRKAALGPDQFRR